MPKNVTQYDILISCPGDITEEEIGVIERSVQKFNDLFSNNLNIILQSRHWSKSAFAQSGDKPQALLNHQFVNDCDAAVALMWTRFGTPTEKYGSGTEEEIENMLSNHKQVFMYFSQKPIPPDDKDEREYEKVKAFKNKYKDKGVYYTYSSNEELESLFFAHLSKYFLTEKRISEIKEERKPKLFLKSIDVNGKLSDSFSIYPFTPNAENNESDFREKIIELYQTIAGIDIVEKMDGSINSKMNVYLGIKKVGVDEETKRLIANIARQLGLSLPDDFFNLGNLRENNLTSILGSSELMGNNDEIRKYEMIIELKDMIIDFIKWLPVERGFQKFHCIKLALQNDGTNIIMAPGIRTTPDNLVVNMV